MTLRCHRPSATLPGHQYWHTRTGICWSDLPPRPVPLAIRTHEEVAEIMTAAGYPMSGRAVQKTEQRALRKLREHPLFRRLFMELVDEETRP